MKRSSAEANRDSMVCLDSNSSHNARNSLPWSGRKQPKEAIRRGTFALHLVEGASRIVKIGIAGVDLDDIVDQNHLDNMRHIDRLIGILERIIAVSARCQLCSAVFSERSA